MRNSGWEVDTENIKWSKGSRPEKNHNKAIAEVPTVNGSADYALFIGLDLVGVVEAKRYNKSAAGDISQAKEYAREIKSVSDYNIPSVFGEYKAPFI